MTKLPSEDIYTQATDWLVRADSGDLKPEERASFVSWLKTSPEHVAAFLDMSNLYGSLTAERLADIEVAQPKKIFTLKPRTKLYAGISSAAMALAACFALAFVVFSTPRNVVPMWTTEAQTDFAELKDIALIDGGTIQLNSETKLSVKYDYNARLVELFSGDAVFTVTSDEDRPFIVSASGVQARAIGTVFSVQSAEDVTRLDVLEGSVAFYKENDTASEIVLVAGEQAFWHLSAAQPDIVRDADIEANLAWRQKRFDFSRTPLFDVAEQFNRYNQQKLEISDPDIGEQKISGRFGIHDIDGFVSFLELSRPVEVTRKNNRLIISSVD